MTAVTHAAWQATRPPMPATARHGTCGKCGTPDQPLVAAAQAISKSFTAYDSWRHPHQPWLCPSCTWGYTNQHLRTEPHLVTLNPPTCTLSPTDQLHALLTSGALSPTTAVVLPMRPGRRHLMPVAEWGRITIDTGPTPWSSHDAALLTTYTTLRRQGFTPPALALPAADFRTLRRCSDPGAVMRDWALLAPWRRPDSPWIAIAAKLTKEDPLPVKTAPTSPLFVVSADGSPSTHLAATGPDLVGTRPGVLPPSTLCGLLPSAAVSAASPGDVECPRCLERAPEFMNRPGWSAK